MKSTNLHRTLKCALLASLLGGVCATDSHAQFIFSSGSNGSYGPMNITNDTTLAMPPDGKFNCTTITVAPNVTLRFTPNALNTPVYLLATGDVTINGTINVSGVDGGILGGSGGPGGFAGGNSGSGGLPQGDGFGPGAGRAGTDVSYDGTTNSAGFASYGSAPEVFRSGRSVPYGSPLLVPLVGGSGGGGNPSKGGTGGGGAILIASNTKIAIENEIIAEGGNSFNNGNTDGRGSGGAIRLVAPTVKGIGSLSVKGSSYYLNQASGSGRIRIDCLDRRSLTLKYLPNFVVSIGANMVVFPINPPRLDITQAAGNNIPVGTNSPVFFMLPQGSSTNQAITVQASNFGAPVPIRVVLTPDNGPSSSYDAQINNTTLNPASVIVPVVVPVNVQVHVNAWTR